MQIFTNIWVKKWEKEGVTLSELYDINVFDLFTNKSIMISVSHQNMLNYAKKLKKKDTLRNYYFATPEEANDKYAHFNAIKKCFENDYYCMVEYKNFLMTVGLGFVTILILFAFAINPTWTESIMYIFIPSLSAIGLIAQTSNDYKLKIRFLENALQVINSYGSKKDNAYNIEGPNSRIAMRSLQDAIFLHRLNDFNIPKHFIKKYQKRRLREIGQSTHQMAVAKDAVVASVVDKIVKKTETPVVPIAKEQAPKVVAPKAKDTIVKVAVVKDEKLPTKKENVDNLVKENNAKAKAKKLPEVKKEVKKKDEKIACKTPASKIQSVKPAETKASPKKTKTVEKVAIKDGEKAISQKKVTKIIPVSENIENKTTKKAITDTEKTPNIKPVRKTKEVKKLEEKHADRIAISINKPVKKTESKAQGKTSKVATIEDSLAIPKKKKKTPEPKAITNN